MASRDDKGDPEFNKKPNIVKTQRGKINSTLKINYASVNGKKIADVNFSKRFKRN